MFPLSLRPLSSLFSYSKLAATGLRLGGLTIQIHDWPSPFNSLQGFMVAYVSPSDRFLYPPFHGFQHLKAAKSTHCPQFGSRIMVPVAHAATGNFRTSGDSFVASIQSLIIIPFTTRFPSNNHCHLTIQLLDLTDANARLSSAAIKVHPIWPL